MRRSGTVLGMALGGPGHPRLRKRQRMDVVRPFIDAHVSVLGEDEVGSAYQLSPSRLPAGITPPQTQRDFNQDRRVTILANPYDNWDGGPPTGPCDAAGRKFVQLVHDLQASTRGDRLPAPRGPS